MIERVSETSCLVSAFQVDLIFSFRVHLLQYLLNEFNDKLVIRVNSCLSKNTVFFSEYSKLIKVIFGVSIWAVVVLCIILRLIRLFRQGNKEQLFKYMQTVLCALCIIFAAIAAVSLVNGVISMLASPQTGIDQCFGVVLLAAELIPYLFDIVIRFRSCL